MIAENLLEKIGFSAQMQAEYNKYRAIADQCLLDLANEYMDGKCTMAEAMEKLDTTEPKNMSIYTMYLIFVLECTDWLKQKYLANGRTEENFYTAMKDILYKTIECKKRYGVFGLHTFSWYGGFFSMYRFATTRLQFDKVTAEKDIVLDNYTVKQGDLVFNCHIPSAGPLTYDLRLKSYKELYEFYKDQLKDGILVIHCNTWLLYDGYDNVFGENSNTKDFKRDFEMYDNVKCDTFYDGWRIFYKDFDGDTSALPRETSMQRAFIKHLDENPSDFGAGCGVILFDGEKILTRK